MIADLFDQLPAPLVLGAGSVHLRGYALAEEIALLTGIADVLALAPLRQMVTPGGQPMSVLTSSCGALGWISDRRGYRYSEHDPHTGQPWPPMPAVLLQLATQAAAQAGYADFVPDACLINQYQPGARMGLHQDRDEQDFNQPIVSVSLGLPAVFLWGGARRSDKPMRVPLQHGDVLVWGGEDRLRYHGVLPVKAGSHPLLGNVRINLTLRKAG
ncbi:DNA oxidative demethylase AlkB [Methylobacillus flagellatus]|uniref:DNA oxidative demethylase AlkB n=1 Tax=Methylobacillus flagellatus TaxID=405 RepID=UPI0010F8108C|nr:DNA oxidative demethylase AlkB [Methylobacillus flagellatus]